MELSAGKLWRMRRLADAEGRFAMLATDQRPPIQRLVREARGEAEPRQEDVSEVKRLLVKELGGAASAVLTDPIYGYPHSHDVLDPRRGLLLTLEHAVYEETPGGRRSGPIPGWTVEAIARSGADAVKVLAWYRPDADPGVREHQHQWVAEVGEACRRHDLPFVFELLVYPFASGSGEGDAYREDPGKRAEAVVESVETFAGAEFRVDVFKLESPIPAAALPEPDSETADRVREWFTALNHAAGRPWVILSAGADPQSFRRALGYAVEAGASGFLAGRAIWWEALSPFPDLDACRRLLRSTALPYLQGLGKLIAAATPWHRHPRYGPEGPRLAEAGPGWSARYGRQQW